MSALAGAVLNVSDRIRLLEEENVHLARQRDELQQRERAAQAVAEGLRDELASLRDDLRNHQQLLADFEDVGIHVSIDYDARTFVIERRYRKALGHYTDWDLAIAKLKQLRAENLKTTNAAVVSAAAEGQHNG